MFRRFMIVCWGLFSIGTVAGLIGYVGYRANAEPEHVVQEQAEEDLAVSAKDMAEEERLEELRGRDRMLKRSIPRERRKQKFLLVGWSGAIFAGGMILWNIIWHTGHWIWMGREQSSD